MTTWIHKVAFFQLAGLLLLQFPACSPQPAAEKSPSETAATSEKTESDQPEAAKASAPSEIIFSAAASTKEIMEALSQEFMGQHKNTVLKVNPGPSSSLANQIIEGAPADLFLSANVQWADKVQATNRVEKSEKLLTNRLALVVPKGNPANVKQPQDLAKAEVKKIALAGEKVPAGMYADQALTKLELLTKLVDEGKIARGQDVRSTLSFVERGEAKAGVVYSTDVAISDKVEVVHEFDPALHDEIIYVLVLLKREPGNTPIATDFYEFLLSPSADATYTKFGFLRWKAK